MTEEEREVLRARINQARRAAEGLPDQEYDPSIEHGTEWGYRKGCKCDECKAASAKKRRERRLKTDPEIRNAKERAYRARKKAA